MSKRAFFLKLLALPAALIANRNTESSRPGAVVFAPGAIRREFEARIRSRQEEAIKYALINFNQYHFDRTLSAIGK